MHSVENIVARNHLEKLKIVVWKSTHDDKRYGVVNY
jgi:hypothetical protein